MATLDKYECCMTAKRSLERSCTSYVEHSVVYEYESHEFHQRFILQLCRIVATEFRHILVHHDSWSS